MDQSKEEFYLKSTENSGLKLKVCGLKFKENIEEIIDLQPHYIGLIFYKNSVRYYDNDVFDLPKSIQKVGVFVNESLGEITRIIYKHKLDVVQIHGNESEEYCKELKEYYPNLNIWKAFAIDDNFDFSSLANYDSIDAILFDTKGKYYGGNGIKFNWKLLEEYNLDKDIILSGGISEDDVPELLDICKKIKQIKTVDINSRFETEPGLKDTKLVRKFYEELKKLR